MKKLSIIQMTYVSMFTVLIIIGAFIKVPVPVVPFTLQFFFTNMAGILLGSRLGSLSVLIYMLLGLAGLPVFSAGGGISYVFVPSFGYIIGFVIGTFVTGYIVEKSRNKSFKVYLISGFAGLLIVYLMGMIYYYIISNYIIDVAIGLWPLFLYCFILAVPGDILLCIICSTLAGRLKKIMGGIMI
ncbi:MAG: biotin transporter BioY [Lachnospiraceae bacterium]|nr:biotin transporter BioY [Lachnoclostridium sp.]MDD7521342.1 biotin transporter BioY [Lachnoclostridium sp.]MDY2598623.1 biotin transporter BioY [Lachnospiraceae bacterium]